MIGRSLEWAGVQEGGAAPKTGVDIGMLGIWFGIRKNEATFAPNAWQAPTTVTPTLGYGLVHMRLPKVTAYPLECLHDCMVLC